MKELRRGGVLSVRERGWGGGQQLLGLSGGLFKRGANRHTSVRVYWKRRVKRQRVREVDTMCGVRHYVVSDTTEILAKEAFFLSKKEEKESSSE